MGSSYDMLQTYVFAFRMVFGTITIFLWWHGLKRTSRYYWNFKNRNVREQFCAWSVIPFIQSKFEFARCSNPSLADRLPLRRETETVESHCGSGRTQRGRGTIPKDKKKSGGGRTRQKKPIINSVTPWYTHPLLFSLSLCSPLLSACSFENRANRLKPLRLKRPSVHFRRNPNEFPAWVLD